jgi:menaquinol-cytochrome c reductase iron-sulfur subunit
VTRRRFMSVSANTLGGIAVAAFALPALGFALGPVFERGEARWEDVGAVATSRTRRTFRGWSR